MKFRHYLETINGVELYPMISLGIFFVFFILLFYYVLKADKPYLEYMENIPLDQDAK